MDICLSAQTRLILHTDSLVRVEPFWDYWICVFNFMVKKKQEWESTPIINYVFSWTDKEADNLKEELMAMHFMPRRKPPVEWMKSKLGKQSYTWVGEYRYWVWEQNFWRVYVNNEKGICFEVKYELTKEQVQDQWSDFKQKIKLDPWLVKFKNVHPELYHRYVVR